MNRRQIWLLVLVPSGFMILLGTAIALIPGWLHPPLTATDLDGITDPRTRIELRQAQARLANDTRSAILQAAVGLVVIAGVAATWCQVQVNRDGQITERFTRAVEQLGNCNCDVRIGGIYALERVAKNSSTDRNSIQFLLGAFVRNHAPWPVGAPNGPEHPTATVDDQLPWMRVRAPDIQTAMSVLGRRPRAGEPQPLSMTRVDLRSITLRGRRLTGTEFRYANLARAVLTEAHLDHCDFTRADLRQATLEQTILTSADLRYAYLQDADLTGADLSQADLRGADLSGARLEGAVLSGAQADETTTWPVGFNTDTRRGLGIIEVGIQEI